MNTQRWTEHSLSVAAASWNRRARISTLPVGAGQLDAGLGARHAAALAITAGTDATAVVISSSSGTVSVYDGGEAVLKLERAHPGS